MESQLILQFGHIVRENESLAPFTWLQIGGPTRYLVEPANAAELEQVVKICAAESIPVRVLGGGSNLLVRESGFDGATLLLTSPNFSMMSNDGCKVVCGGGARLSHLITYSVGLGLSGLEHLVGIPGTVGGALHGNSGTDDGDIGQCVRAATLLSRDGVISQASGTDLAFSHRKSSLDELVILDATFELERGDVRTLTKREQTFWILKRSRQPSFPARAAVAFVDPAGANAADLIQQSGFAGTVEKSVQLSSTYPNHLIASTGATSSQVVELLERVRKGVLDRTGVQLQSHLQIW